MVKLYKDVVNVLKLIDEFDQPVNIEHVSEHSDSNFITVKAYIGELSDFGLVDVDYNNQSCILTSIGESFIKIMGFKSGDYPLQGGLNVEFKDGKRYYISYENIYNVMREEYDSLHQFYNETNLNPFNDNDLKKFVRSYCTWKDIETYTVELEEQFKTPEEKWSKNEFWLRPVDRKNPNS